MECIFDGLAELIVHAIGEEPIETGAFVDFVEVGERLALVEDAGAIAGGDGWAVRVVEHAFGEVAGGEEVVEEGEGGGGETKGVEGGGKK